jgi:hypothetical protein
VPDAAKAALLDHIHDFEARLGPKGAAALASWAASMSLRPSAEVLVTLATKGSAASAASIVKLLGAQADTIEEASLKSALRGLGSPYAQLTATGRDRPKVPAYEGIESVLVRLRDARIVSKYTVNSKKGTVEVSKRLG